MICSGNALTCHPETPCRDVRAISAAVQRKPDGAVAFAFTLDGNVDRLRIPSPGPSRRAHRLWQHTCCEAFIASPDAPGYYELNFAPSGAWAVYAFQRYREGTVLELDPTPAISVRRAAGRFELEAMIRLDRLPGRLASAPLRLGLSAVVEDEQGERSYWALRHPPGQPDFHHPDAFALELAATGGESVNDPPAETRP